MGTGGQTPCPVTYELLRREWGLSSPNPHASNTLAIVPIYKSLACQAIQMIIARQSSLFSLGN